MIVKGKWSVRLLSLTYYLVEFVNGLQWCSDTNECADQTYVYDADGGVLLCSGYNSCQNVYHAYSSGSYVACSAYASCNGSDYVQAWDATDGYVFCEGPFSCDSIKYRVRAGHTLFCRGYWGCSNTALLWAQNGDTWCVGMYKVYILIFLSHLYNNITFIFFFWFKR